MCAGWIVLWEGGEELNTNSVRSLFLFLNDGNSVLKLISLHILSSLHFTCMTNWSGDMNFLQLGKEGQVRCAAKVYR